jgi:mitochondrial fission protein ELM1
MPVIWLIDAYRAGERAQVRALVDALGWPCDVKTLDYRRQVVLPHALGLTTLRGITRCSAQTLQPPWPDLVISCGVRNEPVCRWIRAQSGGRTRYVHVGRPWGRLASFDLVITTPQYRVPERANVLHNATTLHGITPEVLAAARERWRSRYEGLPAPRIAVIAGGDSGPFTLGPRAAHSLASRACQLAREESGSLLLSTSSRTSPAAVSALAATLDVPHDFYRWRRDDPDNPYLGLLAWADRLIVSGDSIAMLSEACATGKPVQIFDTGGMRGESATARDFRLGGSLYHSLLRWGWQPLTRDITLVHQTLMERGACSWLGDALPAGAPTGAEDIRRATAAVRALLGQD